MTNQQKWKALAKRLEEIEIYDRCLGKLNFDRECCAPEEAIGPSGDDIAVLGKQYFKLTHAKGYEKLICELHADSEGLTPLQKKTVALLYKDYAKVKNISAALNFEMDQAYNRAYGDWLEAKKASDFSLYRDSFAALIDFTRKAIDLRDEKKQSYYDTLLDDYEEGGSIAQLDAFFSALKARIVPLMRRIRTEGKPIRSDFMPRPVPIPQQEAMSRYLLELPWC